MRTKDELFRAAQREVAAYRQQAVRILKQSNQYISRNWRMVAEGIRMAQYLFCVFFIKELY